MIVEDDAEDRILIDEAFVEIDFEAEVKKFINGRSLLHYLETVGQEGVPSLIVLDNTLPELDATDLITILKSNPDYRDIAIVVYTTMLTPSMKQQFLSMGVYACYEKGNTLAEIVQVAKELRSIAQSNLQTP